MLDSGPVRRDPKDPTSRWLAVAAGGAAILLLLLSLVGKRVLVDATGFSDLGCGLRVCEICHDDGCESMSTLQMVDDIQASRGEASAAWGWSGTIAWIAAIIAALGLAGAVAMVARQKFVRIPVMSPTSIGLVGGAIALIAGCVFVATKPETVGVTRVGWTFWVFGVAVIAAITSSFLLSRQLALLEPDFDPGGDEPWDEV